MKILRSRWIPTTLLKRINVPSLLEISLIFNLANYEGGSGWRDSKSIQETNRKIELGLLKFSSQMTNLDKYLKKLIEREYVEVRKTEFLDERKRKHHKKEYRLILGKAVFIKIFDVFQTLDEAELSSKGDLSFVGQFEKTDYYMRIPHITLKWIKYWYEYQINHFEGRKMYYEQKLNKEIKRLTEIELGEIKSIEENEKKIKSYLKESIRKIKNKKEAVGDS